MRTIKKTAIVGGTVAALMGGGVAFAAWTTTGIGTGSAVAGSAQSLVVTTTQATGLVPNGTVNVPFTVRNPNSYQVTLNTVSLGDVTVDSGHGGCLVSSVTGATLPDTDVIPGGATSPSRNFVVAMSNAANDACQGATFTFTLTASGASS